MITVHVPKSAELAALLSASGGRHERQLNALAGAAEPGNGMNTHVVFSADPPPGNRHASQPPIAEIAGEVTALLQRARAEGNPHADLLLPVLRQLGAPVPEATPPATPPPGTPAA